MKTFDQKEAITFGWNTAKQNWRFFVPLLLIVWGITDLLPRFVGQGLQPGTDSYYLYVVIFQLIGMVISVGLLKISLKILDKKTPKFSDLLVDSPLVVRFIGASILYYLIVGAGLILLIFPGVIWGIKFGYYRYLIVDKNMGVRESLTESAKLTDGNKKKLLKLSLALIGVNLLGLLGLLVGLFWSVPTTMIASAFVYRKLAAK